MTRFQMWFGGTALVGAPANSRRHRRSRVISRPFQGPDPGGAIGALVAPRCVIASIVPRPVAHGEVPAARWRGRDVIA